MNGIYSYISKKYLHIEINTIYRSKFILPKLY